MPAPKDLSVIVIAQLGGDRLEDCLRRLEPNGCECLVVLPDETQSADDWSSRFPAINFIVPHHRAVPLRRLQGATAAHGEIVAFLEDTSLPGPGWCKAVCDAFGDRSVGGAGGPVNIAPSLPARYKALACSEFGRFHPKRYHRLASGQPYTGGVLPVYRLPGNNLAYRRALLMALIRDSDKGIFETEINSEIRVRDMELVIHPGMATTYVGIDRHGGLLSTRLSHGRLFASGSVLMGGVRARATGLLKACVLPLILSARSLCNAWSVIEPGAFPKVALWLCAIESSWAVGEGIGYVAGAGDSLESWH